MPETLLENALKEEVAKSLGDLKAPVREIKRDEDEALTRIAGLTVAFEENFRRMGLERLETLAATLNQVLNEPRKDGAPLPDAARALVYEATGRIKTLLLAIEETGTEPEGHDSCLIARLLSSSNLAEAPAAAVVADQIAPPQTVAPLSPTHAVRENSVQKIWRSLRTSGFMRTVQRALQRFVPVWAFDMNRMAVCEVDLTEWQGAKPDPQWNYRLATPEDTELLMSRGLSRFEVDRFFDRGAFGSVLEIDGQLIANNWAIPNHWACFDWIGFELAADEIYGASSFVAPAYRGQRIHHQTRSFMYGQMAALGFRRAITLIEVLNKSSLKASAHRPRKYHGFLSYVRLLGLVVYKLNGKWGVGFWNQKRPLKLTYQMLNPKAATDEQSAIPYPRRDRRTGGIRISEGWRREIRARKTRVENQRSAQNAP